MPFCFFMIRDEALFRTINLAMSCTVYLVQVSSLRGKHQKGRGGEGGENLKAKVKSENLLLSPQSLQFSFLKSLPGIVGQWGW